MAVIRTTLGGLPIVLARIKANIHKGVSDVAGETAVAIVEDLVENTPVDTSQAISNWTTKLGGPVTVPIGPYFPGKGGSTKDQSGKVAVSLARALAKRKKPKVPIYISNPVDYIVRLNELGGRIVPGGFVEKAHAVGIDKAKTLLPRIKLI